MAAPETGPRAGHSGRNSQEFYLLLLQRGRGHQGHQEHPEGEGGQRVSQPHLRPPHWRAFLMSWGDGPWGLSLETNPFFALNWA